MIKAISNTSPLLYLYRAGVLDWLPQLFSEIWTPLAVVKEMREGSLKGFDVPDLSQFRWLQIKEPRAMPSEWLALDLGPGELAAMSLALENPDRVILLDDLLARHTAQAAGLTVWGTLKVLLEAKYRGITPQIKPIVEKLSATGLWMSRDIRQRVLALAKEN